MTTFHEGLSLIQRDRGAAWFADPDGARLLLSSEIGSEGRNFQFAHHLVLFDLPLDPGLLEQRLGRLDRIGQTAQIHVHVPYVAGSHQEVLARWYHDGLDAFAEHLAGGRQLLDQFAARLRELGEHMHDRRRSSPEALDRLIADTREARRALAQQLEEGRDRLLEWQSFRPHLAAPLIDRIHAEDDDQALDRFVLSVLDLFMIQVEELAPRTFRLGSAGVLVDEFPGLPADGLTLTADRRRALAREELQFMTWDHPVVTGAVDLLLSSEKGNCSMLRWIDDSRPALYLEAIFVVECVAPAPLHVDRFLPPTPVTVVVDHRGELCRSLSLPPPESDVRHLATGRTLLARDDIREKILPRMIDRATELARLELPPLVDAARDRMTRQLDHEITRLLALQQINRSVRQEELDVLVEQRSALDESLTGSRIRLDAVRLIDRGPRR
jgi:ATP-dependent helicase HepA